MRWKLVVLVSLVAALLASLCWFLQIILFFNGSASLVDLNSELWPLSTLLPFLLAVLAGFIIYRRTSQKRKTQAVVAFLAVLLLIAIVCFAVTTLLRRRKPVSSSPIRLSAPTQSLSGSASTNQ
jgi:hypothetical protein